MPELEGRVRKVARDSGTGFRHSGDLADASLLVKAECKWAADSVIMEGHGILAYGGSVMMFR